MRVTASCAMVATLLASRVSADFLMWFGSCDTGFGSYKEDVEFDGSFEVNGATKVDDDGCGGTAATGEIGGLLDTGVTFGNPCNPSEELESKGLDIYVSSTGQKIGTCELIHGGDFTACNGWSYACLNTPIARCKTDYCV